MEQRTDILIVGAGVIGSACAWFASHLDADITVLEQKRVGSAGSTSISRGLLRVYEPQEALAPWAAKGLHFYRNWPHQQLGVAPTCHEGLLYRIAPENLAYAESFVCDYNTDEYPIRLLRFASLKSQFASLNWSNDDWVVFEPFGGYGDPIKTAQRFLDGAITKGVKLHEQHTVQTFEQTKEGLWRVTSKEGVWLTRTLIIAAGAYTSDWFPELDLRTRSIAIPVFQAPQSLPCPVIDEIASTYLRPLPGCEFIVGSQCYDYGHWSDWTDQASPQQIEDSANRVKSILSDSQASDEQKKTLGFDGYTSDFMPILEPGVNQQGLMLVIGFSGRGYKLAPAIGQWVQNELHSRYKYTLIPEHPIAQSEVIDASF